MVLPAVQWALNTAWRKRLQATPYHVKMGREPRTAFTALIEGDDEVFNSVRSMKIGCNSWWFLWWIPKRNFWQGCCNASEPIVLITARAQSR